MKMIRRLSVLKFLVGSCLVCLFTVGTFPLIVANYSEYAFRPGPNISIHGAFFLNVSCSGDFNILEEEVPYNDQIKYMVGDAAVSFLKAKSEYHNILRMIESKYSGLLDNTPTTNTTTSSIAYTCTFDDFPCNDVTDSAKCVIKNLEEAVAKYDHLIEIAGLCQRNEIVTARLMNFPYQLFFANQVQGHSELDKISAQRIEALLSPEGNVIVVYTELRDSARALSTQLTEVMNDFCHPVPTVAPANGRQYKCIEKLIFQLGRINYNFTAAHIFGQHVSEVFLNIKVNYFNDVNSQE